jgi:CxxC motif-containing protein (DUF1111 family)
MTLQPRTALVSATVGFLLLLSRSLASQAPTEAPAGFDDQTNGFMSAVEFRTARAEFDRQQTIADGLGPVYTARSCAACHGQPRSGGASQNTATFIGHPDAVFGPFLGATARLGDGSPFSLAPVSGFLWPRSICSQAQMSIPEPGTNETIRSSRIALSALGDGFVEAVPDATLVGLAIAQAAQTGGRIAGEVGLAVAFETNPPTIHVGRFGWKASFGSLLTFAAAAYSADLGITNRIFPAEAVPQCDTVPDPEDAPLKPAGKQDIDLLAAFLRSTKAPPRELDLAATPDAIAGEALFESTGCATCHTATLQTAPAGTVINGGTFTVPVALGDKIIHPYGDYLLHDVGTGDGTTVFGLPPTVANKLRTAPLWGVRMRNRLMHDGESRTFTEAILRHQGEASAVTAAFVALTDSEKAAIVAFLRSL